MNNSKLGANLGYVCFLFEIISRNLLKQLSVTKTDKKQEASNNLSVCVLNLHVTQEKIKMKRMKYVLVLKQLLKFVLDSLSGNF